MLNAPQTPRDALESLSALLLIAWGLILFMPNGETFARPGGYSNMRMLAPEMAWAAMFLGIGAAQMAGATPWRRPAAFLAALAWGIPAVCFGWSLQPLHAPIIYGALAVAMAWCAKR